MDFDLTVIRTIDASDRTMLNPRMLNSGMLPIVIEVSKPEVQDLTVEKSAAETMVELLHNPTYTNASKENYIYRREVRPHYRRKNNQNNHKVRRQ